MTNLSELTTRIAPFKASFFASIIPLLKNDQLQEKRENRPSQAKPGNISDTQKIQTIPKKSKTFQKFPRSPKKSYNSERNPKEPRYPTTIPKTLKFLTKIQKKSSKYPQNIPKIPSKYPQNISKMSPRYLVTSIALILFKQLRVTLVTSIASMD